MLTSLQVWCLQHLRLNACFRDGPSLLVLVPPTGERLEWDGLSPLPLHAALPLSAPGLSPRPVLGWGLESRGGLYFREGLTAGHVIAGPFAVHPASMSPDAVPRVYDVLGGRHVLVFSSK